MLICALISFDQLRAVVLGQSLVATGLLSGNRGGLDQLVLVGLDVLRYIHDGGSSVPGQLHDRMNNWFFACVV